MNITQLKTLVAVVEEGSFSKAARVLGVSQPGVTMQIQSLEGGLGQSLLIRHHRGVELTEVGEVFMPFAYETLARYAEISIQIDSLKSEASGPLHLALSTTPGDYIVPALLGDFLSEYPKITPILSVSSSQEACSKVEDRSADIGFVGNYYKDAQLTFTPCGTDELILIAHPDSDLAQKSHVALADLLEYSWVRRLDDSGTQKVIKEFFTSQHIDNDEFDYVVELGTGEAIVNAVEGKLGIAMVSRYVAARSLASGTIVEVAVAELPLRRPFYLATPKQGLTRSAEAFKEFLLGLMKAEDE